MRLCIFGGPSTVLHNAKREFDFDGSYLYTYIHTYLDKWNKKNPGSLTSQCDWVESIMYAKNPMA